MVDEGTDAGLAEWVPAGRTHQHAVRRQMDAGAGPRRGNTASRQQRVQLIAVAPFDVDRFPPGAFLAEPLEIDAPRLFAELEEQDFLRLALARDHFAPP